VLYGWLVVDILDFPSVCLLFICFWFRFPLCLFIFAPVCH